MTSISKSANALRFLSADMVEKANSGHPGLPMGMADVVTVLFQEFLVFNPNDPLWPNRDRFVLSAGHGSALLYSVLHLCGYPGMTLDQLKNFRQWGSITPGHPEHGHTPGVEATTGPLGQGFAMAVGMALGQQLRETQIGHDLCNNKTYVLCSDGDLMEGISQEALSLAGHLALKNLIVLFDDNGITIDGSTHLSTRDDHIMRFQASGWNTIRIDGHNPMEIRAALKQAQSSIHPTLIACKTIIGYGAPTKAGTSGCHGSPLGADEIQKTRENLDWPYAPFEIPADVQDTWTKAATRHLGAYNNWKTASSESLHKIAQIPTEALRALKELFQNERKSLATRVSSQKVLDVLMPAMPQLVGGSADLTPSNNTKAHGQLEITPNNFSGQYIHFGIREHAMAAALNGLSLYGNFIPYGGTFLVFSDYMRPSIRLSALMKQGVIYVCTHDSIGLGEDGPTHQPVEHLTALRAIPNLLVFRPADSIETLECWQSALAHRDTPSILALSRQNLPLLARVNINENLSALGGYIICDTAKEPAITLIATGSEVSLAIEAKDILATKNIAARVVSMPCRELFDKQPISYKNSVFGNTPRIIIEAGIDMCWHKYMRDNDQFIGMTDFGASAPAPTLYNKFNINVETVVSTAERMLSI